MSKKTAVITGAGGGIGRASAMKLAEDGFNLVIVDFNETIANETLDLVKEKGAEAIFVKADVSNADDVNHYVQKAVDTFGTIDVFFNNAGVVQKFSMFTDIEEAEFDRVMNINTKGVFLGMKAVLKVMEQQGHGHIINTASTAGVRSEHSAAAYSASKHAVVGLTKGAALEYVSKGIRVNAICPGGVATPLTKGVEEQMKTTGYVPAEISVMRMGRYSEPQEIANVVSFLASDASSYMTGTTVMVDGGLTL
ncbi:MULTISPECIES: SDR family NAD(P)-dependent oxidoreductase [Cytobacillus]|uniref:SDR family oxidoreductase n=1 Tax=Cytobacillus stercorigallinarum TaxID=2762240 RepID=A0ABR8QS25_9BACI|nr:SDR family NAD(P)-dependent oxidoreductase [Cytobacillus stercorigallinarum]MBD7938343.1 SDR family oxidoreductase [Cytobacillus stercorigallinarum]